jgi:hypothetical protein
MKHTLNEEIQRVREIMGLKPIIIESRQSEEISLNFLKKNGIERVEDIVKEFVSGDQSTNQKNIPIMAYLYVLENKKSGSPNIKQIINIVNEYNKLLNNRRITPIQITKNGLVIGEQTFNDYLKFTEHIHSLSSTKTGEYKLSSEEISSFIPEKKPMWSGNNIDIYEGNNVGKCIAYSQGGLTGKYYSFCIGKPGELNMYKSYRDNQTSTFYFIVDRNKFKTDENGQVNLDDPLHIVVFDVTNNGVLLTDETNSTGTIAEYGQDTEGYINYLKSKGVPVDELLVNRPKTDQERYEDTLLRRENPDLSWFMNLDNPNNPNYRKPELEPGETQNNYYKSAYIGRGWTLSDEQFNFLMNK